MRGGRIFGSLILGLACGLCWTVANGRAEDAAPDAGPKTVAFNVTPAKPSYQPLRNNLLPKKLDLQPGNAVPLYLKACLLAADASREKESQQLQEKIGKWLETPPADLPRDEVRAVLQKYRAIMNLVRIAARRERCEWDFPFREQPFYSIVLPELQWLRTLARVVALDARLKIADGNPDEAIQDLQTGFAMARHAADAPTLVNGLVGVAIAKLMFDQLCVLITLPNSDNLYWSLSVLPDPLIDLRPALEFEGDAIYLLCPQLRGADTADRSEIQWQADLNSLLKTVKTFTEASGDPQEQPWVKLLELATQTTTMIPKAKAVLREDGWPDERIDGLLPAQLIVVGTAVGYAHFRDETFKWRSIPYGQGEAGGAHAEKLFHDARDKEVIPLAGLLLPAIGSVRRNTVRLDRSIAALRIVEALRGYAATHDGKLPERLDEVVELPIPLNPQTGKPFEYSLKDGRATLAAPPQTGATASQSALRFEISIAR